MFLEWLFFSFYFVVQVKLLSWHTPEWAGACATRTESWRRKKEKKTIKYKQNKEKKKLWDINKRKRREWWKNSFQRRNERYLTDLTYKNKRTTLRKPLVKGKDRFFIEMKTEMKLNLNRSLGKRKKKLIQWFKQEKKRKWGWRKEKKRKVLGKKKETISKQELLSLNTESQMNRWEEKNVM